MWLCVQLEHKRSAQIDYSPTPMFCFFVFMKHKKSVCWHDTTPTQLQSKMTKSWWRNNLHIVQDLWDDNEIMKASCKHAKTAWSVTAAQMQTEAKGTHHLCRYKWTKQNENSVVNCQPEEGVKCSSLKKKKLFSATLPPAGDILLNTSSYCANPVAAALFSIHTIIQLLAVLTDWLYGGYGRKLCNHLSDCFPTQAAAVAFSLEVAVKWHVKQLKQSLSSTTSNLWK